MRLLLCLPGAPSSPSRHRRHAALLALTLCALWSPAASALPSDSTDALAWARRIVSVRETVDRAERERDPVRQAALADTAFAEARSLIEHSGAPEHRSLLLRAQQLYETYHGGVAAHPLTSTELWSVRGAALAAAEADPDAGGFASERIRRAAIAAREEADHAARNAAGPAHLSVPYDAETLVDEQSRIAERHFSGMSRRTRRYFPMIERTLARRGLPADLKYVAVIESALNPDAESHAGAVGLWQFMPDTAADFGLDSLTVRDPAQATDAAARFLRRLHRMFRGDWQLALAAYNSGPGRVGRIVRTFEEEHGRYPTFWDIQASLPRETQDYVPRFIAVARLFEPPPEG